MIKAHRQEREKRLARLESREPKYQMNIIPHLHDTFIFAGIIHPESQDPAVMAIIEQMKEAGPLVYLCPEDFELNNWTVMELPSFVNEISK